MKETWKNNLRLTISIILLVCSFFCWYLFAQRERKINDDITDKYYIDISSSSRGITIKNMPENVFFRLGGELVQSGSIDLK